MNRTALSLCLLVFSVRAVAESFDNQGDKTKEHVVGMLQRAISSNSVVIIHARWDEGFRREDKRGAVPRTVSPAWLYALGLVPYRWVGTLVGMAPPEKYGIVYVYPPLDFREMQCRMFHHRDEYTPIMGGVEEMCLVFMRPAEHPDKSRADPLPPREPRFDLERTWFRFRQDAQRMSGNEFLKTYDLGAFFSDRVFRIATGCVFRVDYPAPELPEPTVEEHERERYELARERAHASKSLSLIDLSTREVSEIVFTAYWLEGPDGAAKYAAACAANPAILVPLADPKDFTSEIGKRLFEAVKAKPPAKESP